MKNKIYIGTSGWSYGHWKGNFYPEKLSQKKWLHFFADFLNTVEINSTFYHLPSEKSIQSWLSQVPTDFLFSIKASRYITHLKRLKDCQENVDYFFKTIAGLKDKLGPILFQLPPSFKMDTERLKEFLSYLNDDHRYVFEFRHPTWFVGEIYEILSTYKVALCITDLNGHLSPEEITTNFTYIRLHGPKKAYKGSYGEKKLLEWKKKIQQWAKQCSVFCYFDNDEKGYAIQDAQFLKTKLPKQFDK